MEFNNISLENAIVVSGIVICSTIATFGIVGSYYLASAILVVI